MNTASNGYFVARVLLDLVLEMPRDVDDLLDVAESLQILHHVVDHRLAGDLEHRLGRDVRVRPKPRALPGQRNDDFHGALVPSRPYRSCETHDVVQVRRGHFEHVAVGHRFHLMNGARRDAECLADLELDVDAACRRSSSHAVNQLAGEQVDGLVLHVVVLHGQRLARLDVQNLADVAVGVRPDGLVAPRLGHGFDCLRGRSLSCRMVWRIGEYTGLVAGLTRRWSLSVPGASRP